MGNTRVELAHKLNTIFHKPPTKNNSSSEVYNYEKVFLNPNAQQLLRIDLTHSREREREREREIAAFDNTKLIFFEPAS